MSVEIKTKDKRKKIKVKNLIQNYLDFKTKDKRKKIKGKAKSEERSGAGRRAKGKGQEIKIKAFRVEY